jgi:hypothetical protein
MLQCHLAVTLSGLFDQFNQAGNLWFRTCLQQKIELILSQIVLQILHHIKVFPPAVYNLKAGLLVVTAEFTVIKRYGIAQSGATPQQTVWSIFHEVAN